MHGRPAGRGAQAVSDPAQRVARLHGHGDDGRGIAFNLQDITNPNGPISLGGNLTFHMSMTDSGTPTRDTIGIAVNDGFALLFSSNWTGTKTVEQVLGGGNLAVP